MPPQEAACPSRQRKGTREMDVRVQNAKRLGRVSRSLSGPGMQPARLRTGSEPRTQEKAFQERQHVGTGTVRWSSRRAGPASSRSAGAGPMSQKPRREWAPRRRSRLIRVPLARRARAVPLQSLQQGRLRAASQRRSRRPPRLPRRWLRWPPRCRLLGPPRPRAPPPPGPFPRGRVLGGPPGCRHSCPVRCWPQQRGSAAPQWRRGRGFWVHAGACRGGQSRWSPHLS